MIVVDTSALIAVFQREPEGEAFLQTIVRTERPLVAAPTRLEAYVVIHRRFGAATAADFEALVADLNLTVVAFDEQLLAIARDAYRRFSAGRHGLNFGDCFAYALAKARDLPLLFKGEDFAATDVKRAL
ncbi:type II toxin-antitoxin system VapC family toxin [Caulobacter endophyticus]|uniref:type II toxin-antitoxin system VapC family toxin n=1 Tax=Caulobacter endophyticus TaxID=2172652 RepID=UPI00240FCAB9|nr:type II toxin-antitoxin system VapC family toxin [Caulobacter endophyticus]MDG2529593.1 type II toxin-antitoxin system VapC family toxin [Caulobacter endophyticus]